MQAPGVAGHPGERDRVGAAGRGKFAARLAAIREDYPDAAYYSLMNLLGSHDTERTLWALTPGADNQAGREFNAANLAFVGLSDHLKLVSGHALVFMVIAVAAAEVAVGLGIILAFYRNKETVNIDEMNLLRW